MKETCSHNRPYQVALRHTFSEYRITLRKAFSNIKCDPASPQTHTDVCELIAVVPLHPILVTSRTILSHNFAVLAFDQTRTINFVYAMANIIRRTDSSIRSIQFAHAHAHAHRERIVTSRNNASEDTMTTIIYWTQNTQLQNRMQNNVICVLECDGIGQHECRRPQSVRGLCAMNKTKHTNTHRKT